MGLGLKQIDRRLKSVKSTRQITRAMKLVSAAKLNRAQEAVTKARAYAQGLDQIFQNLLSGADLTEIQHPLMIERAELKRIRLVLVGGSRGLCGAYNSNLSKQADQLIKKLRSQHGSSITIDVVAVGRKPAEYCRRAKIEIAKSYEKLAENPNLWPINEICSNLELDFSNGVIDEAYLIGTRFITVMTQKVEVEKLLPFSLATKDAQSQSGETVSSSSLTLFEPSAAAVFSNLIPRLIRVKVQQSALDARASEHANRMTAMDSATKNAGDLIDKLGLLFNRLRQQGITGDLLDIVGGAEAISQN